MAHKACPFSFISFISSSSSSSSSAQNAEVPWSRGARAWLAALVIGISACGAVDDSTQTDESRDSVEADKADTASELAASVPGTTLWMQRSARREQANGDDVLVLAGRTSRNLSGGFGFICDDAYGDFTQRSPRTFELSFRVGEARGLITGVNQFVRLDFATGAQSRTGFMLVQPELEGFSGSGAWLATVLSPVLVRGRTRFRLAGSTASKVYDVSLKLGGVTVEDVRIIDATHFVADLTLDQVLAVAETTQELEARVQLLSGPAIKRARIGLAVKKIGLTTGDAYQVWPGPVCTAKVKSCLGALPAGSLDLAACGSARAVLACSGQVGLAVERADILGAEASFDARLAAPVGLGHDAAALVGSDQVSAFKSAVRAAHVARLDEEFYVWYLDAKARDAALALSTDEVVDRAYATPLELVPPHTPQPGDLTQSRQVAADGLLLYLAKFDFAASEYGKPLRRLTRDFRSQHVTALRDLRESAVPQPSAQDLLFITTWLSSMVEVNVAKTTGEVTRVLLEID